MHILTKITANNKFQIKQYCLGDGYFRQKAGRDTELERNKEYAGEKLAIIDANRQALDLYRYTPTFQDPYAIPVEWDDDGNVTKAEIKYQTKERNYCTIPEKATVAYVDEITSYATAVTKDYYDFLKESQHALDLFKKSQYSAKKERPWGRKQKPKAFRYQAGEKIKEGGAVIDKFVGATNSHMITCTLPGSTWEAMDALSRWSGWVINRLVQHIRNKGKVYKDIYWFFVWEHQGRGALHLHFCLGWKTFWMRRESLAKEIEAKFYDLLFKIGKKEKIDMFAKKNSSTSWANNKEKWQSDVQRVRKSVSAYFAKYCQKNAENININGSKPHTKGGNQDAKSQPENQKEAGLYPSRYWGSSRTIKTRSRYLTCQRKNTFANSEDAEHYANSIRQKLGELFNFKGIHKNNFQIEHDLTGRVISSGTIETYVVEPSDFVAFWTYCSGIVIERDKTSNPLYDDFLQTETPGYYEIDIVTGKKMEDSQV